MTENIERVIFPHNNRHDSCNFFYDDVGLYSISIVRDAKATTQFFIGEMYKLKKHTKNMTIMDGTGGLGGNAISFCFAFKKVNVFEIDKDRFTMLSKNISNYKFDNYSLHNHNCLVNLNSKIDIYFFDPPWGGPEYKNTEKLRLKLGDNTLLEIVENIRNIRKDTFISFKLPFNYDLKEFIKYKLKTFQIRNSLIILIFP
tara:strand:- start:432 stop:1031 length:600 start_codon:yes stop_codon:yes gene_type:complete